MILFSQKCELKSYGTYSVLGGQFKVTKNAVIKWVWVYDKGIQSLKESKVQKGKKTYPYHLYLWLNFCFSHILVKAFIRSGQTNT